MLPIEVGLTMSFIFAIFLAVYHVVTMLLASMLLNTLHLPVSYFHRAPVSSRGHREKLDHVYDQACRDDLKVVYWLWFGHHHLPLDLFFLTTTLIGILLGVSARRELLNWSLRLNLRVPLLDDQVRVTISRHWRARVGVSTILEPGWCISKNC